MPPIYLSEILCCQGFFGPRTATENVYAAPVALQYFKGKGLTTPVVVSPDAGGVKRAKVFKDGLAGGCRCSVTSLPPLGRELTSVLGVSSRWDQVRAGHDHQAARGGRW